MGSGASKPEVCPAPRPGPERSSRRPLKNFMSTGLCSIGPQLKENESMSFGLAFQDWRYLYCSFFFHKICLGEETGTVLFSNANLCPNPESLAFTRLIRSGFEDHLNILTKERKLDQARIRFLFFKVQELLSLKFKEMKDEFDQAETSNLDEESDWDEIEPEEVAAHKQRETLRNLRELEVEDSCAHCKSSVVIITETRIFVAGPGRLVTAIASPSGFRTLALPGEHSEDVKVFEFEGGLKHDEFLVMFMEPSHAIDAQSVSVSGTEDVAEMCEKLLALDRSGKPLVFVAKRKDTEDKQTVEKAAELEQLQVSKLKQQVMQEIVKPVEEAGSSGS